jgi:SAM-dependent methyltransferase
VSVEIESPQDGAVSWLEANRRAMGAARVRAGGRAADAERLRVTPATSDASFARLEVQYPDGRWRTVHSTRDPWKEADGQLATALGGRDVPRLVFIVGGGLGYLVDRVLTRAPEARVIVLEPSIELADALLAARDWREPLAAGRLRVLAAPEFAGVEEGWRAVARPDDPPTIVTHPVIAAAFPDVAASLGRTVSRIVADARMNAAAETKFAGPYLLNTLSNLGAIFDAPPIATLDRRFNHVPAIVCAAGPSLDQNVETLLRIPRVRERVLIVAADTALRPLLVAGLTPHFVVSVDPGAANARTLLECPPNDAVRLVAEGSLDPRCVAAFAGRTWFFRLADNQPWPALTAMGLDPGVGAGWGSVVVSAFDLAVRLGAREVVFAGADLAFTNNRPYARHTIHDLDWAKWTERTVPRGELWRHYLEVTSAIEVRDLTGRATFTAPHLAAFRDRLVRDIARHPQVRVRNGTGAGLLEGPGITQMSLEAVGSWKIQRALIDPWSRAVTTSRDTGQRSRVRGSLLAAWRGYAPTRPAADPANPLSQWQRVPGVGVRAVQRPVVSWLDKEEALEEQDLERAAFDAFAAGRIDEAVRWLDEKSTGDISPCGVIVRVTAHLLRASGAGVDEARALPLIHLAAVANGEPDVSADLARLLSRAAIACAGDQHASYLTSLVETFVRTGPGGASAIDSVRSWRRFQAEGYFDHHPAYRDRAARFGTDRFLELLKPRGDERLLELGCGYGRLLAQLRPHVRAVVGVEPAAEPLRVARELLGADASVTLVQGDGVTLWPVPSHSLDMAVAFTVLQHLSRAATRFYLRDLRRVLVTDGLLCVQVRTGGDMTNDVTREPREQSVNHRASEIVAALENAGFDLLSLTREGLPSPTYAFLWLLARAR